MNPPMPPCQICGMPPVRQYLDFSTNTNKSTSRCAEHDEFLSQRKTPIKSTNPRELIIVTTKNLS